MVGIISLLLTREEKTLPHRERGKASRIKTGEQWLDLSVAIPFDSKCIIAKVIKE